MEELTAVYEQVDQWWIGYVEELPGANAQGRTLDETRESLKEAVRLTIEANREVSRKATEGRAVIREVLLPAASWNGANCWRISKATVASCFARESVIVSTGTRPRN